MANPLNSAFRGSGLAVLVALQYFHGADWQKGVLASVPFIYTDLVSTPPENRAD